MNISGDGWWKKDYVRSVAQPHPTSRNRVSTRVWDDDGFQVYLSGETRERFWREYFLPTEILLEIDNLSIQHACVHMFFMFWVGPKGIQWIEGLPTFVVQSCDRSLGSLESYRFFKGHRSLGLVIPSIELKQSRNPNQLIFAVVFSIGFCLVNVFRVENMFFIVFVGMFVDHGTISSHNQCVHFCIRFHCCNCVGIRPVVNLAQSTMLLWMSLWTICLWTCGQEVGIVLIPSTPNLNRQRIGRF